MKVTIELAAARQIQRERVWLVNNRGPDRADAFEDELRHALELLEACPHMGAPSRWGGGERAVFLRRSRFHVFYKVYEETDLIRVVRIRHEKQRP